MRRFQLLLFIAIALFSLPAYAKKSPFRTEIRSSKTNVGETAALEVVIVVPAKHHVYRDMLKVKTIDAQGLNIEAARYPKGTWKPNPAEPDELREQFDSSVRIRIPFTAKRAGFYQPEFEIKYQGCKKNLCYMPQREKVRFKVSVSDPKSKPKAVDPKKTKEEDPKQPASAPPINKPIIQRIAAPLPEIDFNALPDSAVAKLTGKDGNPHPLVARLIVDKQRVAPGATIRVGVHFDQDDGWHTYGRPGGDTTGLPPSIEWKAPKGTKATPYEFAIPKRYHTPASTDFGYDDQNLIYSILSLPSDLPLGNVVLGAKASWQVCKELCIREEAELNLSIEVSNDATLPSSFAPLFDAYQQRHPKPLDTLPLKVETALSTNPVAYEKAFEYLIRISPKENEVLEYKQAETDGWPFYAPILEPRGLMLLNCVSNCDADGQGPKASVEKNGNSIVLRLSGEVYEDDPPKPLVLGGLFQLTVDGQATSFEFVETLPVASTGQQSTEIKIPMPISSAPFRPIGPQARSAISVKNEGDSNAGTLLSTEEQEVKAEAEAEKAAKSKGSTASETPEQSFIGMLLLAFLGGLILNIMPCVLPVLSLKLYSLIGQKDISDSKRKISGLMYTAGILVSFLALGLIVVALKGTVGWGFQMQSPVFIAFLATVVFAFGLSLLGVFEVPTIGANQMSETQNKEGMLGYFLTGVFCTLLATPCSAPFLGTGMGFAFSLEPAGILLFFATAGFGLAFPFLIIAFVPFFMKLLPRPGAWMEKFKEIMGFTLLATTVWLVDVMGGLTGREGTTGLLAFLTVIGFGAWIFGAYAGLLETGRRQLTVFAIVTFISILGGRFFLVFDYEEKSVAIDTAAAGALNCDDANRKRQPKMPYDDLKTKLKLDYTDKDGNPGKIPWVDFSNANVKSLNGHPIFIDFTADWCVSCKGFEKLILETDEVKSAFQEHKIVPMKADNTKPNKEIDEWLTRYKRAGVPFYVVIPADQCLDNIVLGESITKYSVIEAIQKAKLTANP